MKSSRLFFGLPADFRLIPHAQRCRCATLWQSRWRLPSRHQAAQGSQARARRGSVSLFQGRHRDPSSARNLHKNTQFLSKPSTRTTNLQRIIGAWQKSSPSVTDRGFPTLTERLAAEIGTGGNQDDASARKRGHGTDLLRSLRHLAVADCTEHRSGVAAVLGM
jgi:hypothetical protein